MEAVLNPRELNLVRSYLSLDQPDRRGMTFQELAIRLNYNGPSGAEKAYKSAIRKLKQQLNGGAYGQWIAIRRLRKNGTSMSCSIPTSTNRKRKPFQR